MSSVAQVMGYGVKEPWIQTLIWMFPQTLGIFTSQFQLLHLVGDNICLPGLLLATCSLFTQTTNIELTAQAWCIWSSQHTPDILITHFALWRLSSSACGAREREKRGFFPSVFWWPCSYSKRESRQPLSDCRFLMKNGSKMAPESPVNVKKDLVYLHRSSGPPHPRGGQFPFTAQPLWVFLKLFFEPIYRMVSSNVLPRWQSSLLIDPKDSYVHCITHLSWFS